MVGGGEDRTQAKEPSAQTSEGVGRKGLLGTDWVVRGPFHKQSGGFFTCRAAPAPGSQAPLWYCSACSKARAGDGSPHLRYPPPHPHPALNANWLDRAIWHQVPPCALLDETLQQWNSVMREIL